MCYLLWEVISALWGRKRSHLKSIRGTFFLRMKSLIRIGLFIYLFCISGSLKHTFNDFTLLRFFLENVVKAMCSCFSICFDHFYY